MLKRANVFNHRLRKFTRHQVEYLVHRLRYIPSFSLFHYAIAQLAFKSSRDTSNVASKRKSEKIYHIINL